MRTACVLFVSLLCGQSLAAASAQNATENAVVNTTTDAAATTTALPDAGKTLLDVQGQSGKFTVYREKEGKQSGIQVTMDALRELDSDGNEVGTGGSTKHSINTFAAQDFTIEQIETVTLVAGQLEDSVNATSEAPQGVSADKISFHSPISTIGEIRIDTYIVKESGLLGPPNETWAVSVGDLKWNIELSSWKWCGGAASCSKGQAQEVGEMIEVDVTVKGLHDAAQGASSKAIELGGGATLELSDQVNVDGDWAKMPTGYPKVSFQGSSTTLTFRFPKFATRAVYDPVITGLGSVETTTAAVEETTAAGVTTTAAVESTSDEVSQAAAATLPARLLAACLAMLLVGRV